MIGRRVQKSIPHTQTMSHCESFLPPYSVVGLYSVNLLLSRLVANYCYVGLTLSALKLTLVRP